MLILSNNSHRYSFAASGIKVREKEFLTREAANKQMYKVMKKYGLRILNTYDDKHDKTYICDNNIRFYIQRV